MKLKKYLEKKTVPSATPLSLLSLDDSIREPSDGNIEGMEKVEREDRRAHLETEISILTRTKTRQIEHVI